MSGNVTRANTKGHVDGSLLVPIQEYSVFELAGGVLDRGLVLRRVILEREGTRHKVG